MALRFEKLVEPLTWLFQEGERSIEKKAKETEKKNNSLEE